MNLIKSIVVKPLLKNGFERNLVSGPEIVELREKNCIGYSITTSLEGNRKKEDIPPFFHDIYDNKKLSDLWRYNTKNMYCIFNMHQNGQDFDYCIATDNYFDIHGSEYTELTVPSGRYVKVELMKRNHTAVSKIMMYLRAIWLEANGYKARKSPAFILYDERFHVNYQLYGCIDGEYGGDPVATYFLPIED